MKTVFTVLVMLLMVLMPEGDHLMRTTVAQSPSVPEGMVLIPAGEFQMGSTDSEGDSDELPVHTVYLDAFYMDIFEVTVGQYNEFVRATGYTPLGNQVLNLSPTDWHPVVGVNWYDAMAYATWAGKRLPTEAEWEKAARGGLAGKKYPWGATPPDGTQCNFADMLAGHLEWANLDVDDGYAHSAPVGNFPPNGYGLYDMGGNVREWCLDAWDADFYANSPRQNPFADGSLEDVLSNFKTITSARVTRGGSWWTPPDFLRVAFRNESSPSAAYINNGFRCVKDIAP
ncbi:MAG: formylglycine-generating enzyme family protein [Candidatus Poribacteria bacterium]|nr:formylglycine-generating enzyme family protein [Candidatus Poribacteria bacterium]